MSNCPDLVRVRLYMDRTEPEKFTEHITDAGAGAQKLIKATLELHYDPGFNPHNGAETAQVWKIVVAQLRKGGPYWWSTPGLQNNYDPKGASLYTWGREHTLWERPLSGATLSLIEELNP